jgi:hypothetical protein
MVVNEERDVDEQFCGVLAVGAVGEGLVSFGHVLVGDL